MRARALASVSHRLRNISSLCGVAVDPRDAHGKGARDRVLAGPAQSGNRAACPASRSLAAPLGHWPRPGSPGEVVDVAAFVIELPCLPIAIRASHGHRCVLRLPFRGTPTSGSSSIVRRLPC
jgi:hypothetical protein